MKETNPLEQELKYFAENQAKWMAIYPGKILLIKGRELIGSFDNPDQALSEGARLFGIQAFLVRRVEEKDENIYIPALTLGLIHASAPYTV